MSQGIFYAKVMLDWGFPLILISSISLCVLDVYLKIKNEKEKKEAQQKTSEPPKRGQRGYLRYKNVLRKQEG